MTVFLKLAAVTVMSYGTDGKVRCRKSCQVVRTLTTNDFVEFSAPNLAVSSYDITVTAANFKKTVKTGLEIDVGARRSADIVLEAGNIDEKSRSRPIVLK